MTVLSVAFYNPLFRMDTFPIDYPRVVEAFEFLQDWDARYQFITELGENLPPYPDEERIDLYHVPECMSTVYIRAIRNNDGSFSFHGDCDTSTVKGVVAILLGMFNGRTASDIDEFDADYEFEKLGLFEHLSPSRHVGVYAMVQRVKRQVSAIEESYV